MARDRIDKKFVLAQKKTDKMQVIILQIFFDNKVKISNSIFYLYFDEITNQANSGDIFYHIQQYILELYKQIFNTKKNQLDGGNCLKFTYLSEFVFHL